MSGHLALTFIDYAGLNAQHNFNREIKTSFSVENILQTILQKIKRNIQPIKDTVEREHV
jgi:hypothetical protein